MYPSLVSIPNNSFGCGADDELFVEFCSRIYDNIVPVLARFKTIVGHNGAFLGKAFHVFGLSAEEALGYQ